MSKNIEEQAIKMGKALGEAISKHVRVTRLEEEGQPTFQATRCANAAFRRFETNREQLVRNMIQAQKVQA